MNKTTVPIKGMHCRSCELLIEDELCSIHGVEKAVVSSKKASADIYYHGKIHAQEISAAVVRAGYQVGIPEKKPFFSRDGTVYSDAMMAVSILFLLYLLVGMFGLSKFFSSGGGHPTSIFAVVLIGITAGVSTCMALVGGIVLGASARFSAKHPTATPIQKFKPHLFFNLGRIGSYILFGGIVGMLGSFFQLGGSTLGLLTLAVALVMLTLGLQLTGLFPRINNAQFTLPKGIGRFLGIDSHSAKEYSHTNSMLLGGLTFFLPCGFTQAMQLYAMSTGSFTQGAAIMGAFALGTAPGLLGIGGLTAAVKGSFATSFFHFAGVVVVILALFNAQNGLNLLGGNPLSLLDFSDSVEATNFVMEGNSQVVRMTQSGSGYTPNSFTIKKGVPVKWIVNATDVNTCSSTIVVSSLGITKSLHPGENTIEFTPDQNGKIPFSCSMGMFTGVFNIVDNTAEGEKQVVAVQPSPTDIPKVAAIAPGCGSGGCGCGGAKKQIALAATPVPAQKSKNMQVISATYTQDNDIRPSTYTVKVGIPVKMQIDVKDEGSGCMSTVMVPGLADNPQFLKKGSIITFEFTPNKTGQYPITCAMGISRGSINVI